MDAATYILNLTLRDLKDEDLVIYSLGDTSQQKQPLRYSPIVCVSVVKVFLCYIC